MWAQASSCGQGRQGLTGLELYNALQRQCIHGRQSPKGMLATVVVYPAVPLPALPHLQEPLQGDGMLPVHLREGVLQVRAPYLHREKDMYITLSHLCGPCVGLARLGMRPAAPMDSSGGTCSCR